VAALCGSSSAQHGCNRGDGGACAGDDARCCVVQPEHGPASVAAVPPRVLAEQPANGQMAMSDVKKQTVFGSNKLVHDRKSQRIFNDD